MDVRTHVHTRVVDHRRNQEVHAMDDWLTASEGDHQARDQRYGSEQQADLQQSAHRTRHDGLSDCPVHDDDCGLDSARAHEKAGRLAPMPAATDLLAPTLDDVVARG